MLFQELLTRSSVCIDATAQSKTAVFLKISQILSQNHPELNADDLFDAYWKRETLGSTAIGHGIIIPHIRSEDIHKTCGCFLKLQNAVDFGAVDKQPIDLVLGLVVPSQHTEQHLQTLSTIIKKFNFPSFRNDCRSAEDNNTLYSVLIQESPVILADQLEAAEI